MCVFSALIYLSVYQSIYQDRYGCKYRYLGIWIQNPAPPNLRAIKRKLLYIVELERSKI